MKITKLLFKNYIKNQSQHEIAKRCLCHPKHIKDGKHTLDVILATFPWHYFEQPSSNNSESEDTKQDIDELGPCPPASWGFERLRRSDLTDGSTFPQNMPLHQVVWQGWLMNRTSKKKIDNWLDGLDWCVLVINCSEMIPNASYITAVRKLLKEMFLDTPAGFL